MISWNVNQARHKDIAQLKYGMSTSEYVFHSFDGWLDQAIKAMKVKVEGRYLVSNYAQYLQSPIIMVADIFTSKIQIRIIDRRSITNYVPHCLNASGVLNELAKLFCQRRVQLRTAIPENLYTSCFDGPRHFLV